MVHIETVDLSARGVNLPSDRVGMVIAQPHVPISSFSSAEPFQWTDLAKPRQLAVISETLRVSHICNHGVAKTHFTIFPEYSIPGFDGITLIEETLRSENWPRGTIVIGGTDALTRTQYAELVSADETFIDSARNGVDRVHADQWVNCAIVWIKNEDGGLERWVQPKLYPAWEELNVLHQHMFRGTSVYLFKGRLDNDAPYRFGGLICFDWIAMLGTKTACEWIFADLQQQAGEHQLPLSWLFVVQRNPKPSHQTFLSRVEPFFNQTRFPSALRERACLVFANTAGLAMPGRTGRFGACSAVLSPQSMFDAPKCVPTFASGGPRFRDGSDLLQNYRDFVFRERGACIHSFAQVNPGSLIAGPAGRSLAIENAHVFPVLGEVEPRAPGASVPASIKWLNDELDLVPSLSVPYQSAPLAAQVGAAHQLNVAALRNIASQSVTNAIELAAQESNPHDADDWDEIEAKALQHVVHTLDIIAVAYTAPTVGSRTAHASVLVNGKDVDILAILGTSHENCVKHSKLFVPNPQRQVLLVSRDLDNTSWQRRFGSYLDPNRPQLGQERNITDPASGSLFMGYQDLLESFLFSTSSAALAGEINGKLIP